MASPTASVVIPTRNRWPLVARAVRAALGQQGVDLEVLVVDDGSADGTGDGLRKLAAAEPRMRILRLEHPRGVSAARNSGIAAARAPWIAFLDDDDVWSPHKLARQIGVAESRHAAWVYAGAIAVDATGWPLYEYYFPDPETIDRQLRMSAVVPAGASNVVVRTELLHRLGGFDEQLSLLEDWDMWIRLADTERPAALREILVAVFFHSDNNHAVRDQAAFLEQLIEKHATGTPPRPLVVDRHGHARWVAGAHSRAGLHRRAALLYLRAAVAHRSPADIVRAADALFGKPLGRVARRSSGTGTRRPVAPYWLERWCSERETLVP